MKIAGTVVLYNPEESLIENINTYLPFLDKLYVMDNSTKQLDIINKVKEIEKVKYISLDGNKGIAKALNVATECAIDDGYDFLLSMDQDSKFPTDDFKIVKSYLEGNDMSKVGIVAVNYKGNEMHYSENIEKDIVVDVNDIITSGSFLNLKNYRQIDGYNENLFIDYVDNDICYQFKVKNFDIRLFPNIMLDHKLGNILHVKFLWYDKDIVVHSPLRYYYMYRNYHYLLKHRDKVYLKYLTTKKTDYSAKYIFRRFLFEKPHFKVLKMIKKGIKDGKKGILGSYNDRRK